VKLDDLVQEARVALCEAAKRYDERPEVAFAGYARPWIEGEIRKWVKRSEMPWHRGMLSFDDPRTEALASRLGCAPAGTEEDGSDSPERMADRIPGGLDSPEDMLAAGHRQGVLDAAIATLPDGMQNVIRAHYYEDQTKKEIGQALGISHQMASRLLDRAHALLRVRLVIKERVRSASAI
jgi:RNA polymerase sigma factor (sigma-70 family)